MYIEGKDKIALNREALLDERAHDMGDKKKKKRLKKESGYRNMQVGTV
jgi:hypothetical protein